MSAEQADTAASMASTDSIVSTEQAYATLEALLNTTAGNERNRLAAVDTESRTRAEMALRAALHPMLRPALEDPLTTIGGAYVSLDARLPLFAAPILAGMSARILAQFPDADWASLTLVGVAPPLALSALPEDSPRMPRVGAIEGALFVPGRGEGIVCGVRAWVGEVSADAWERERLGWEPPRAVRSVGPAIGASAGQALRAALLLLCADDALPPDLRPGPVFYDVCAPLSDAQMAGIDGDSLELPLALAFLSALTRRPLSGTLGATGALAIDETSGRLSVEPVGTVPAKAAAFFASFGADAAPCFLVPVGGEEASIRQATPVRRATPVATFRDAVEAAFPEGLSGPREAAFASSDGEALLVSLHACIVSDALRGAPYLRVLVARLLREALNNGAGRLAEALRDPAPDHLADAARFANVGMATAAAARLLRTLRCYPWSQTWDATLLPGIGIDAGEAEGDFGRAAAIAESAASGRILLSANAVQRHQMSHADARLTPLGAHRLCDLRPPLALSEWTGKAAAQTSASPAASVAPLALRQRLDDRPHNLPVLVAPLFGRASAVAELETLLRASAADAPRRTITLTGVGGVGKTRLALEVAAGTAGAFADGVWVVPVGAANTAEEIAVAVAETLRLDLPGGTGEIARAVGESLTGQQVLLVLDGSEESATGGAITAFLATLHDAAPGVVCLVTARVALGAAGETVYPVLPLDVPSANAIGEAASDVALTASVALFYDCARRAHPGFVLSGASDWQSVAAISRRLAGLPLAIELAAAPVGALTLPEIDRRLAVATTAAGEANRPVSRAWSVLRQTIEWANALLDPADQTILADLSVFVEGFTATDAATVCAEEGDREAVAESLLLLEQRSLIRRPVGGDRFYLLRLVQDFARRRLEQSGRLAAVQARHARCFVALAAREGATRDSEREVDAFDRLDAEMGNLRATVDFLRVADPSALPALVDHLWVFLRQRGHPREWRVWPRLALRLLAPAAPDYPRLYARLTLFRGVSALDAGELEEATVLLQTACDQARAHQDERTTATALNLLGLAQSRQGRWSPAQASHDEARDRFRRLGDRQGEIAAMGNLALLFSRRGEKEAATQYYRSVVDLCRAIDDRRGLALAVGNLGVLALDAGDAALARIYYEESLRESRKLRDTRQIALAMLNLGDALIQLGEGEQGVPLVAIAEALLRRLRHTAIGPEDARRLLAEAEPGYGTTRLAALRAELARYAPPALLQIDPSRYAPRALRLVTKA